MTCLPLPSPGGWALSPGVGGWAGGGRLGSSRDAPDLVVAGAAVDRAVAARDERDLGHYAALGAGGRVHLARGPCPPARGGGGAGGGGSPARAVRRAVRQRGQRAGSFCSPLAA